jgi:hypothetical protein
VERLEQYVKSHQTLHIRTRPEFFDFAVISPSTSGFQVLRGDSGIFYLSVDRWENYASGYRIRLRVGNPMAADFDNVEIVATWGDDQRSETKVHGRIRGGSWNRMAIVVAPATPEEIENVTIRINTPTVILRQPGFSEGL